MRRAIRLALTLAVATALIFPSSAAAFNPDARCYGLMVSQWTVEVDPGTFEEGQYTFWWKFTPEDPPFIGPLRFTVSDDVPVVHGNLFIYDGRTINPAQDGYFWAGWAWDMTGEIFGGPASTMQDVRADLEILAIRFNVAPGTSDAVPTEWVLARGGPATSLCANSVPGSFDHRTYPSN